MGAISILKQHPFIIVLTLVIAALLAWGFLPQPVLVDTEAVRRGPLEVTVEEEGRTRVIDRYVISAPVDGVACRVELDVGDSIQDGQVLLYISPLASGVLDPRSRAQAKARIEAAEAAFASAREQARAAAETLESAEREQRRLAPLVEKSAVSREVYDNAVSAVSTATAARRSADFNVEVAKYELDAAKSVLTYKNDELERVPVHAPINGQVLKVGHECEGPVRTGDPLLEVGDASVLEVEVDVLSADAVRIKPGMKVTFDRWGGEGRLEGVARVVEPVGFTKVSALGVEEQRVLVISDLTSPPEKWKNLGDGYRVEAKFIIWHEDNVLQVPVSSLFRYQEGWAVFVVDNEKARRRSIEIGKRGEMYAEVLKGLSEGEVVINHPSEAVEDGTRVQVNQGRTQVFGER